MKSVSDVNVSDVNVSDVNVSYWYDIQDDYVIYFAKFVSYQFLEQQQRSQAAGECRQKWGS